MFLRTLKMVLLTILWKSRFAAIHCLYSQGMGKKIDDLPSLPYSATKNSFKTYFRTNLNHSWFDATRCCFTHIISLDLKKSYKKL